jgi:superfamily II DNA or RNA helicase/HKD family nuclease
MKVPLGLYEKLVTEAVSAALREYDPGRYNVFREPLDSGDSHIAFTRHVRDVLLRTLTALSQEERVEKQAALCNRVLELLDPDRIAIPAEELLALVERTEGLADSHSAPKRPAIPLSSSDLLVNARDEPSVGHALASEFSSADRVDLICAFIRWNGIRILEDALHGFFARKRQLRALTTTYTGSTERRALDHLVQLGAQVKVSYDTQMTRLHAKAWLFHRNTGFSTAYIGSSNLSRSAMVDGREWNVRLSQADAAPVLEKFAANFESYWADPTFETYEPERDRERFDRAVQASASSDPIPFLNLDLEPFPFQREILQKLEVERTLHGRHRNLIVSATGTGKTFVAAFDYKALRHGRSDPTLLYVAHRKEILTQSLQAFRLILRDGSFGELYVDGARPEVGKHVFASIQSLALIDPKEVPRDFFDVVIVDEFHHAAAETYRQLLDHLQPMELLGLTATPERADGQTILERFDGRIAAEIRLWEALERGLLCPFQYFGISDATDLSNVRWTRRGYDTGELQNLYTANDARVRLILDEVQKKISDPRGMRALGFCVSVAHAQFMAERFTKHGLPALAISATSGSSDRADALRRLRKGEVNVLFAVDLFNEGLDIPEIDTVLFLRPTESATIFLQQLGRGLRQTEGKECLTVLDFIGQASSRFRFDLRYRALTGASRTGIRRQIEDGFPYLPAGCTIQLDRISSEIVLENISRSIGSTFKSLVTELRSLGRDVGMAEFLAEANISLGELYRNSKSWSALRRLADLSTPPTGPDEERLTRGLGRLIDIDDPEWLAYLFEVLKNPSPPSVLQLDERYRRILSAFHFAIWGAAAPGSLEESLERIWRNDAIRQELLELLVILRSEATHLPIPLDKEVGWEHSIPLSVRCRYSLDDVLTAFGGSTVEKPYRIREGIYSDKATGADLLFITLAKTERHYSPTTLYRDYAVSPDLFHWESRSTTSEESRTGKRHVNHRNLGVEVLLFVRERRDSGGRTQPYMLLGPADYVSHVGERPMAITWKLRRPMPADFFRDAKVAAG